MKYRNQFNQISAETEAIGQVYSQAMNVIESQVSQRLWNLFLQSYLIVNLFPEQITAILRE